MQKDFEQLGVAFNNRAHKVFFTLYNEFKHNTAAIDRLRDENVFQQLQSKYVYTLKQQLENIAKELISISKIPQGKEQVAKSMSSTISEYITEFTQKVRCL